MARRFGGMTLLVLVALVGRATPARATTGEAPINCAANPDDPRCRKKKPAPGARASGGGGFNIPAPVPAKSTGVSGGGCGGGGGGGGGGNLGVGILVVAVVVVAALPIIIYFVDEDAPKETLDRYGTWTVAFDYGGGAVKTSDAWTPIGTARATGSWYALGVNAEGESGLHPSEYSLVDAHLLLAPPPKMHLEGGLALGFARQELLGVTRSGFDLGLPHTYVFGRGESVQFGIEARPAVRFGSNSVDVRLELGMSLLIAQRVSLEVMGQAFSFNGQAYGGVTGGMGLHI
jgi:hypothetical protein